jgi:hypothetical protein
MEARSQEPEGIGAVLALAGCFELDAEIPASGSWLLTRTKFSLRGA